MERIIASLLIIGVVCSAIVVFIGGVAFLAQHGRERPQYARFASEPSDLLSPRSTLREAEHFDTRAVVMTGLLILVMTPVLRVAFSVFAFARERDWTYTGISALVLLVLLYGLASY